MPWAEAITAVLMPTTWPARFRSGPPELPGLMAASVWMNDSYPACPREFRMIPAFRPVAEMIPAVAERKLAVFCDVFCGDGHEDMGGKIHVV
jgi:hypothetical protein